MWAQPVWGIVNPVAGSGRARHEWPRWERALRQRGYKVRWLWTERPGDAVWLATQAVRGGAGTLVVLGGDGTLHEAVNGLRGNPVPLVFLPAGTTNLFAWETGIPMEPSKAVAMLEEGHLLWHDVGLGNDRAFLMVCGIGLDGAVMRHLPLWAKRLGGEWAFLLLGMGLAPCQGTQLLTLHVDGHVWYGAAWMVILSNTQLYGGRVRLTPEASQEDGALEVAIVQGCGLLRLYLLAFHALLTKRPLEGALSRAQGEEVYVEGRQPLPVQMDGEVAGWTPLQVRVLPRAQPIWVPTLSGRRRTTRIPGRPSQREGDTPLARYRAKAEMPEGER